MVDCRRLDRGRTGLLGIFAGLAVVVLAGCDLDLQQIIDAASKGPVAPGTGSGGGAAVPPPADAGAAPQALCMSSNDCTGGLVCSVERGDCRPHPACKDGMACPAVCYGVCEVAKKPDCRVDGDCGAHAVCSAGFCVAKPTPPRKCDDIVLAGDQTTCRTVSEWKLFAHEACLEKKLELVDYSAGGGDCGPDSTRMVKYQCCEPAPVPPTPTPPVGSCTGGHQGGETSCKSPEIWKSYAIEACAQQGAMLVDIGYGTPCDGGNYRYMKYTCCGGTTAAPPVTK